MQHAKKEQREMTVIDYVTCDRCGKTCRDSMGMNYECSALKASWGYGSKRDTEWKAEFCEDCSELLLAWSKELGAPGVQISSY